MIKLGDKARDKVSGFAGIVTAKTEWLNIRFQINAQKPKGSKPAAKWFDENQIVRIGGGIKGTKKEHTGGARHARPQRSDPGRV